MAFRRRKPSGKTSFHPRPSPRRLQSGVSKTAGGTGLMEIAQRNTISRFPRQIAEENAFAFRAAGAGDGETSCLTGIGEGSALAVGIDLAQGLRRSRGGILGGHAVKCDAT